MMKKIGKMKMILAVLASACVLAVCPAEDVQAAEGGYTYTVNIYAGNRGTFTDAVEVTVDHTKSGSTVESQVKVTKGMIAVSGLVSKDRVILELRKNAVKLKEEGRYYVKGIRQSGRDNNTVTTSIFEVDRDTDYVAAYGVKGDMVAYTVNYQDADGNELLPSDTYYGSVGDKPVVAYRYVEGYEPEVAALTRTLTDNEARNVFTFIYSPVDREVVTRQVGTAGTVTTTVTELVPGAPAAPTVIRTPAATTAPAAATEAPAAQEEAPGEEAAPGEATAPEEETGDQTPLQEIGDEEVPLAGQDLKDLDEEEVPASEVQLDKMVKKGLPLAASVGIAVAAAAGLAILFIMLRKRKREKGAVK